MARKVCLLVLAFEVWLCPTQGFGQGPGSLGPVNQDPLTHITLQSETPSVPLAAPANAPAAAQPIAPNISWQTVNMPIAEARALPFPSEASTPLCTECRQQPRFDPNDPTQVAGSLAATLDWRRLQQGEGNTLFWHYTPTIPIGKQLLLQADFLVPGYADIDCLGQHLGAIGDTRLKLSYIIPTADPAARERGQTWLGAIAPFMDLIAPTGDRGQGLGGGDWVFLPGVVFALEPTNHLQIYPLVRYIGSSGLNPDLSSYPEIGIPVPEPGAIHRTTRVDAFSIEVPFVFTLDNAIIDAITLTGTWAHNFSGFEAYTMQFKLGLTKALSDRLFLNGDLWLPVTGNNGYDFLVKAGVTYAF